MKKSILSLLFLLACFCADAQFSIGLRESRYAYGSYRIVNNLSVKVEQSLYSEKLVFQRIGIGAEYYMTLPYGFQWSADLMGATTWNGNYQVVDLDLSVLYRYRRLGLEATIDPRYDSGLGYETCWQVGGLLQIIRPIAFVARYTTIPLYRMSEKRIAGGLEFKESKLSVRPELSFSLEKATRFKNIRVLVSMNYDF